MKYLILLISILFLAYTYNAKACQLSIPESYMDTFLNPPVSGHYEKCEAKPDEPCVCVDDIDPWTAVKVDEVDDAGIYTGKKLLRPSPVRKAAKEAKEKADREAELAAGELKRTRKDRISKAKTIADLKAILLEGD